MYFLYIAHKHVILQILSSPTSKSLNRELVHSACRWCCRLTFSLWRDGLLSFAGTCLVQPYKLCWEGSHCNSSQRSCFFVAFLDASFELSSPICDSLAAPPFGLFAFYWLYTLFLNPSFPPFLRFDNEKNKKSRKRYMHFSPRNCFSIFLFIRQNWQVTETENIKGKKKKCFIFITFKQ